MPKAKTTTKATQAAKSKPGTPATAGKDASRLAERILASISEEELVSMACDVVNIPSPTGEEAAMARYLRDRFQHMGLEVTWQEVEEGRANVIARLAGSGNGRCLMFNGHMDTSNTGREEFLTGIGYKPQAVIKNGYIYGLGIYNMKGALVCYTQAVQALQRAGVQLEGDVIIAGVAGEIEKTQWSDEFSGRQYRGYGAGTHYLVNHGTLPDMCILGEPTDMKLVLAHYGSVWARFSVRGLYAHTAFATGREEEHAVRRMRDVLNQVIEWADGWRKRGAFQGKEGFANIGCLRAGHPWRASRTPDRADLFLDVRVPPTMPLQAVRHDLKDLYLKLSRQYPEYGLEFETYVSVPGASIAEGHPMIAAIERNHRRIMGRAPERDTVLWSSDASVMTRYGIETVNYGPSSGPREKEGEKVAIQTLMDVTRIYALTAAELCGAH